MAKTNWSAGDDVTAADLNSLGTEVNGKAASSHTHSTAQVTGLDAALSGKASASHNHTASQVTDLVEAVQDVVGAMVTAGSNTTVTYNDGAGTLTIDSVGGSGGGLSAEEVRDTIGAALVEGSGIDVTVNDAGDTITIAVSGVPTSAVTGLDTALAGKAAVSHTHSTSQVTGLDTALSGKAPLASPAFTGTPTGITKTHVGLGNVDNTADTAKPISTATQTALDGKAATSHTHTIANVSGLQTALDGKADAGDTANTVSVLVSTGDETRPDATVVLWIGGDEQPTNMGVNDLWFSTDAETPPPGVAPTVTTTSLNAMTQSSAFTQTLAASGDTPITWAVTTGTAPAGLTLSSAGVLSGTPTTAGAYSFTVTATNAEGSDTQAYSGTVAAAPTSDDPWLRRTQVTSARNGTTTHAVTFAAATTGNLLVMVAGSSAAITTPSGWTRRNQALGGSEVSVYTKTATSGEASASLTLSAANYPLNAVVYEFGSAATWVNGVTATATSWSAANPTLSGLTGTNLVFGVANTTVGTGLTAVSTTWTGTPTPTEDVDVATLRDVTDGCALTVAYVEDYASASFVPTAVMAATPTNVLKECITFAVKP